MAISDIGKLIITDFLNATLDYGLHFLTRGQFYFTITSQYEWGCHLIRGPYFYFPHILNWTLFLLNLERLCIVTFPLHARKWFTVRFNRYYIVFLILSGVLISVFAGAAYNRMPSQMLDTTECLSDFSSALLWISFRVVISIDMYIGPNVLSLVIALVLIIKIHYELSNRASLVHSHYSQSHKSTSTLATSSSIASDKLAGGVSLSQISGALTAVTMAVVHAVFYLPDAIFGIYFYQYLATATDLTLAPKLWMCYLFTMEFASFGSITDFFIYTVRIPSFRSVLCNRGSASKTSLSSEI